jgi:uncharacterized membrane protein
MIPITEIHPMLVHFPIVFWISAETIAVIVLLRGGDLSVRQRWPAVALYSLLAGTAFACVAALFGDIALDNAVAAGFTPGPMETHEAAAVTTLIIFGLHTALRILAIWRKYPLAGVRGWLAEMPGLVGIAGLMTTAYLGGQLVYHMGVNVEAMIR